MNSAMIGVLCFAAFFYNVHCGDFLPSYIKQCDFKDNNAKLTECVRKQIQDSLKPFTGGIPQLGVPSTDPVDIDDIVIDGNGLKLVFTKAKMHGLSNAKVSNLKVNLGKSGEAFTLGFKSDLSLAAKYDADGRILILPIKGNGDAVVKAQGVEVTIEGILKHIQGKGGDHFKLVTPTYKYTIEKTTFDLQNLFNGNKQLAETTIKFANENWQQLMDELAPPAIKKIVKAVIKAINKFFDAVTIPQIVKSYS